MSHRTPSVTRPKTPAKFRHTAGGKPCRGDAKSVALNALLTFVSDVTRIPRHSAHTPILRERSRATSSQIPRGAGAGGQRPDESGGRGLGRGLRFLVPALELAGDGARVDAEELGGE